MTKYLTHNLDPVTTAENRAYDIVARLRDAGFDAFTVGGAVRDRLLGGLPGDVDVTTSATPDIVQEIFARTYAVGAAFGVVIVVDDDVQTEVATFREDGGYQDGRRPDSVRFSDAQHDAQRRDFTINALLYDPLERRVVDYVDGLADLHRGVLRAIGDPVLRFNEDYLRLLRAVRFAARFDFALDGDTLTAIKTHAHQIINISPERIFAELSKMLCGPRPGYAFRMLDETGLLEQLLPEITAMKNVAQPPLYHPEGDVFVHTLMLLDNTSHPSPEIAWSALLHDVGKPPTFEIGHHGRETFPCHAKVGAAMTETILQRLRCSRQFIDDVREAVYNHMTFADVQKMRPATLRRMLGRANFNCELELHRVDCMSSHRKLGNYVYLLDALIALRDEPAVPPPLATGKDLLARGVAPGPVVGEILRELEDQQLSGDVSDREAALVWLDQRLSGWAQDRGQKNGE